MQLSRLLDAHHIIIGDCRELARRASRSGDDGTNDLVVSQVLRCNEMQVWSLSEHLVDTPPVEAEGESGYQRHKSGLASFAGDAHRWRVGSPAVAGFVRSGHASSDVSGSYAQGIWLTAGALSTSPVAQRALRSRTGMLTLCWTRLAVVPRTRSATSLCPWVPMASRSQLFSLTHLMISLAGSP